MEKGNQRKKIILFTSIAGILSNIVLAIIKVVIGYLSHSVAIVSDGANNATDSLSSIVTIVGYKVSERHPTKAHPLGFGRAEYISAMAIAFIVIFTGITFLEQSIEATIHPEGISISSLMLMVLIFTIFIKIFLWRLDLKMGKKAKSEALTASGLDAVSDAVTALITIIAAVIEKYSSLKVDGPAGIIVSAFIIYNGCVALKGTLNSVIGERPKKKTVEELTEIINKHPPLNGCFDIMIHSYGPVESIGSCNVEVPENVKAETVFDAIMEAKEEILEKTGIYMTIGMLAVNNLIPEVHELEENVLLCLKETSSHIISIHAFHIHFKRKLVHFDMVVDFDVKDMKVFRKQIGEALKKSFPKYSFEFNIDPDYA